MRRDARVVTLFVAFAALAVSGPPVAAQASIAAAAVPANDDFAKATVIRKLPFSRWIDDEGWSLQAGEPAPPTSCWNGRAIEGTAWFRHRATTTRWVRVPAIRYGFPVAVYTGSRLANLKRVACGSRTPILIRLIEGQTYHFQVGDFDLDQALGLRLTIEPIDMASASKLPWAATRTADDKDLFVKWAAPSRAYVRMAPRGMVWHQKSGGSSPVTLQNGQFIATKGATYIFQFHLYGKTRLRIERIPGPPSNDDAADAKRLTTFPTTVSVNTTYATTDGRTKCVDDHNRDVWYSMQPSEDAVLSVDATRSTRGVIIGVTTDPGSRVCGHSLGQLRVPLAADTRYWVRLAAWPSGAIEATFSMGESPSNTDYVAPQVTEIGSLPFTEALDNEFAPGPSPLGSADTPCMRFRKGDTKVFLARDRELWWLWTADTDRVVRVTNGSDHTTIVDVFQRIGMTPLTCSRTAVEFQAVAGETYAIRIQAPVWRKYRETKAHFPHGIVRIRVEAVEPAP